MKTLLSSILLLPILLLAQVKSPGAFLGYELGDKFTRHHQVVDYYKHLAASSNQITLIEYGKTYEDRPLLLAFVSSETNIQNLAEIRTNNLKRTGILDGAPSGSVGIVWLSYNVHGNESSSTEASMATIYELVKEGSDKKEWLENTVVVIDPCINPDGRDRYVNFFWENANQPYNPDPNSIEHNERAPWGRSNHYLFDLNRDWAWQTQKETQSRIKVYNRWLPQIHVDFHEQGINSPYFFAPAAQPYHELISTFQHDFQVEIGKNHAKYFDKKSWFYFTKEVFDLLYPSYGDTYPTYNGAIGMTYEQAGHGRAGLGIIKQEGDTLTLKDRIAHHYTTGLSTIEIAARNKDQLLTEFGKFFGDRPQLKYKTFVLKYDDNEDQFNQLKRWLDTQGIQYGSTSSAKGLRGYNYSTGSVTGFSIGSKDLVVNMNQPKATLAHILLEPQTELTDSVSYDLTAWGIPYVYGIQAYAMDQLIPIQPATTAEFAKNEATAKTYTYFTKWNSIKDAQFLAALLNEDIKVRFTERAINYKGDRFEKGSLVIAKRDNMDLRDSFEQKITDLANDFQRRLTSITTGFMDGGPDIGSSSIRFLKKPKIAMLKGGSIQKLSFGAAWHFMEQELNYPFAVLGEDYFGEVDLSKYDVLIMPDGAYGSFGEEDMNKIMDWVSQGGKLIVIQRALNKFKDSDYSSLSIYNSEEEKKQMEETQNKRMESRKTVRYEEKERVEAKNLTQAIFKVTLDNSHPLAFGYGDAYYTVKTERGRYGYLKSGNVGVIKSDRDLMSGFAGQYVREDIAQSLALGVENKGEGQIIYFVDDPLFRSFWQNGKLLMVNAMFLVGQ